MSTELIIAVDVVDERLAYALIKQINPAYCILKIGSEIFTALGP